jgi:Ca2+-binding EF-hand superfamily protein
MDWINKIHMIVEKMKNQLHAKGIDSLDRIYVTITNFDQSNKGYVENIFFENFLAKMGIFLKTQELSELHKYLKTWENNGLVGFESFIELLKCEVPENILNNILSIFELIKEQNNTISVETLKKIIKVENHPRVKLMMKSRDAVRNELEFSILFVSGDKGYLYVNDFVELHRNMYWVTPKEDLTNFNNTISRLWGAYF